jgi:sec-independent protein translocase protein TatC
MIKPSHSFIVFLAELRRSLKLLGLSMVATTGVLFFLSPRVMALLQAHLGEKLYFFSVAGPFLAHVRLAFFGAVFLLMPLLMQVLWQALGKPFGLSRRQVFWFVLATCVLFYGGALFCALVTLPFGIKFLLGFQSEQLEAVISVSHFINFVALFVLAFGTIFELPVFMVFSARVGAVRRQTYEKHRRYALLVIAILAALLTPTPDLVNMALMGGPLYLLYECGILLIRLLPMDAAAAATTEPTDE